MHTQNTYTHNRFNQKKNRLLFHNGKSVYIMFTINLCMERSIQLTDITTIFRQTKGRPIPPYIKSIDHMENIVCEALNEFIHCMTFRMKRCMHAIVRFTRFILKRAIHFDLIWIKLSNSCSFSIRFFFTQLAFLSSIALFEQHNHSIVLFGGRFDRSIAVHLLPMNNGIRRKTHGDELMTVKSC